MNWKVANVWDKLVAVIGLPITLACTVTRDLVEASLLLTSLLCFSVSMCWFISESLLHLPLIAFIPSVLLWTFFRGSFKKISDSDPFTDYINGKTLRDGEHVEVRAYYLAFIDKKWLGRVRWGTPDGIVDRVLTHWSSYEWFIDLHEDGIMTRCKDTMEKYDIKRISKEEYLATAMKK